MTLTYRRHLRNGRTPRPPDRSPRRRPSAELGDALEGRALLSIVGLTGNVSPMILRQINPMNQPHAVQVAVVRPVTLAGYVSDDTSALPTITFRVVDQAGRDMPAGTIAPQPVTTAPSTPATPAGFFFSTRFGLSRARRSGDLAARHYTVFVTAQDAQNSATIAIPVSTPPTTGGHVARRGSDPAN